MVGICHFKYARIARNQAAQDVLCIYWWAINKYKYSARVLLSTRLGSIDPTHRQREISVDSDPRNSDFSVYFFTRVFNAEAHAL